MSEITDKLERILLEFAFLPDKEDKDRIRAIATRIEAAMSEFESGGRTLGEVRIFKVKGFRVEGK